MGVIKQGILGGFSGKVGSIVGTSWKGIAVMKALPLSVANPRTASQVGQRTKFTTIVELGSALLSSIVKPLWDRFAQKQSGYNAFISTNVDKVSSVGVIDFQNVKMSVGSLTSAPIDVATAINNSASVTFDFVNNSGTGSALPSDEVYAVCINQTTGAVASQENILTRADEYVTIIMPANNVTGQKLACYLSFRRADGTIVSDSSYLEKTVTAS
jgi:hypothetical protein